MAIVEQDDGHRDINLRDPDREFRGPKEYVVEWTIDVVADSPEAAAKAAWDMMRAPDSTANVFDVIEADGSGEAVRVDLQEVLESE